MFSVKRLAKKASLPSPVKRLAKKSSSPIPHPHVMMPIGTTRDPAKNAAMHISPPMPQNNLDGPFPAKPSKRAVKATARKAY